MPIRLDSKSNDFSARFAGFLAAKREASEDVAQAVRSIIADVRARGDRALVELTNRFDRVDLEKTPLRVSVGEMDAAHGGTAGETPVPAGDVEPFLVIQPEIGVTGTPVIDPASNTIYVVSTSEGPSSGTFHQRLHGLDLATGREKAGAPVEVIGLI